MRLFRRSLDLSRAAARITRGSDLTRVSRLLRDGSRRYYGLAASELAGVLGARLGAVLEAGGEIWGVALAGWPAADTTWLRGVALGDGIDPAMALELLLPPLHAELDARGLRRIYYAGDESADPWLSPALRLHGYQVDTEVIVYEKRDMRIPAAGSQDVLVRPARPEDLAAVLTLDQLCFEPHWTKDDAILGPAIDQGPIFLVAELESQVVGYAYATSHFSGRLVHLVRIAVLPQFRGQAVGVRLLAEVVSCAEEHDATTMTLNTQAYNSGAQRLYRWFGFAPTGERQMILRCDLP